MNASHSHGGPRDTTLTRFAWLSVAAAVATIALKLAAYQLTGSVGLLSDAAESVVNLVAAFVALFALKLAARPANENHPFGHSKAEYFSAGAEGVMIFVAAAFILWSAVGRMIHPTELDNVGIGLGISVFASLINGAVALVLLRAGRIHNSVTLVADGKHLMTDVVTSAGVVVGVLLVALTGWLRLDPIIAFGVGLNIIWTGWGLIRHSLDALLDHALPTQERAVVERVLDEFRCADVQFHAVRTRAAGQQRFLTAHILVPGEWTVAQGHDICEAVTVRLREELGRIDVETHLEPVEDERAYEAEHGLHQPHSP